MPTGTVNVDDLGNVTGSGTALELYNAIATEESNVSRLPNPAVPDPDFTGTLSEWGALVRPLIVKVKRSWAREARAHADSVSAVSGHKATLTGAVTLGDAVVTDPADATKVTKHTTATGHGFRGIAKASQTGQALDFWGNGETVPAAALGLGAHPRLVPTPGVIASNGRVVRKEFPTGADVVVGVIDAYGNLALHGNLSHVVYAARIDLSQYLCGTLDGTTTLGAAPPVDGAGTPYSYNHRETGKQNTRRLLELFARCRAYRAVEYVVPPWNIWWAEEISLDGGTWGFMFQPGARIVCAGGLLSTWDWCGDDTPDPIGYGYLIPFLGGEPKNTKPTLAGTPTVSGELLIKWTNAAGASGTTHFVWRLGRGTPSAPIACGNNIALTGTGVTISIAPAVAADEAFRVRLAAASTRTTATATRVGSSTGTLTLSGNAVETFNNVKIKCVKSGNQDTAKFQLNTTGEYWFPRLYATHQAPPSPGMPQVCLRGTPTSMNGVVEVEWLSGTTLADGTFHVRLNGGAWTSAISTKTGRLLTTDDNWSVSQQLGWTMPGIPETLGCELYLGNGTYAAGQLITITVSTGLPGPTINVAGTAITATASGTFDEGDIFTFSCTGEPNAFVQVGTSHTWIESIVLQISNGKSIIPWDLTEAALPRTGETANQPVLSANRFVRCGAMNYSYLVAPTGHYARDGMRIGRRRNGYAPDTTGPYNVDMMVFDQCIFTGFAGGYAFNLDNDSGQAVGHLFQQCQVNSCWGCLRVVSGSFSWMHGGAEEVFGPCFKIVRLDRASYIHMLIAELTLTIVDWSGGAANPGKLHINNVDHNLAWEALEAVIFQFGGTAGNITVTGYTNNAPEGFKVTIQGGIGVTNGGELTLQDSILPMPLQDIVSTAGGLKGIVRGRRNSLFVPYGYKAQNNGYNSASTTNTRGAAHDEDIAINGAVLPMDIRGNVRTSPTSAIIRNAPVIRQISGSSTKTHIPLPSWDPDGSVVWVPTIGRRSSSSVASRIILDWYATNDAINVWLDAAPGGSDWVEIVCVPTRSVAAAASDPLDLTSVTGGVAPVASYDSSYFPTLAADGTTLLGLADRMGANDLLPTTANYPAIGRSIGPRGSTPMLLGDHAVTGLDRSLSKVLTAPLFPSTDAFCAVIVLRHENTSGNYSYYMLIDDPASGSNGMQIFNQFNFLVSIYFRGVGTFATNIAMPSDGKFHILVLQHTAGGAWRCRLDGVEGAWTTPPGNSVTLPTTGARLKLGHTSKMWMLGAHLFNAAFSTAQLKAIEARVDRWKLLA